jgi:hypothetical protein
MRSTVAWPLLAASPLLLLWRPLRHVLEGQMTLLQFPWLLACGAAAFCAVGHCTSMARWLARIDDRGLFTMTLVLCVSAVWMVPVALDLAVLDTRFRFAKYLSWYFAGLVVARGATRLRPELWVFLLGNLSWMLATAGILIRESEARLCVNYLLQDQFWAGTGLVALALALVAWCLRLVSVSSSGRTTSQEARLAEPACQPQHSGHVGEGSSR